MIMTRLSARTAAEAEAVKAEAWLSFHQNAGGLFFALPDKIDKIAKRMTELTAAPADFASCYIKIVSYRGFSTRKDRCQIDIQSLPSILKGLVFNGVPSDANVNLSLSQHVIIAYSRFSPEFLLPGGNCDGIIGGEVKNFRQGGNTHGKNQRVEKLHP